MNREQLKEIIRQELELTEGLFMGPSKGKSKPKTVNVRHKTSGKELVIRDNPTNIKKYKRLGFNVYEGLFMGPSKSKSKTVNVRHKTSGKELVIQDNPTNIKKYKRLGFIVYEATTGTIQEHDRQDILKHLVKKGSNPKEAEKLLDKHYDYLEKRYRKASVAKKAEVLVTLGALDAGR